MKELDYKKVHCELPISVDNVYTQLEMCQSKLLHAIIIMQHVIDKYDKKEVNIIQMQNFVSQFEKS